jgi:hypothetical protein
LKNFQQTLTENFQPDFDFIFSVAITIAIKILIRITQTLMKKFSAGSGYHTDPLIITSFPPDIHGFTT